MNRAWIPAGALAGVSVAGLIALGPLTSSLTTQPSFSSVVTVPVTQASSKAVPVSYRGGVVGHIKHATFQVRGGQAAGQSGDTGQVADHIKTRPPAPPTVRVTPPPPPATAKPAKKQPVKRQTSIGGTAGPNGDTGLASGGSNGSTGRGETQSTPASENP